MGLAADSERLQITLKKDLVEKMDKQRKAAGLSRSAYISNLIGQAVEMSKLADLEVLEAFSDPQVVVDFAKALKAEME